NPVGYHQRIFNELRFLEDGLQKFQADYNNVKNYYERTSSLPIGEQLEELYTCINDLNFIEGSTNFISEKIALRKEEYEAYEACKALHTKIEKTGNRLSEITKLKDELKIGDIA